MPLNKITISMPAMYSGPVGSCPIQRITPYHGESFCSTFTMSPTSKGLSAGGLVLPSVVVDRSPSLVRRRGGGHSCSPAPVVVEPVLKVLWVSLELPASVELGSDEDCFSLIYWS